MSEHRRENRPRQIDESYCVEPTCEFNGKHAQQGVCFNLDREGREWEQIFAASKRLSDEMLAIRKEKFADDPAEYTRWLEAMYETAMMNWGNTLDECICLRVENRRLKERAGAN